MKKIILILVIIFITSQVASANARFDMKRIKEIRTSKIQQMEEKQTDKKVQEEVKTKENNNDKEKKSKEVKNEPPKSLTNYQYDDVNYKYNRINKYIQSNIDYSKSGQRVRFN